MNAFKIGLASLTLCLVAGLPAHAASSAASSASESVSTSIGSISDSFKKSSDSSSKKNDVADGDYRVIEVAELADRPGTVRMKLQAVADATADGEFYLQVPRQTVDQAGLAAGAVITARHRVYGIEFAKAEGRQAFFLALTDDWYRELQSKAVVL